MKLFRVGHVVSIVTLVAALSSCAPVHEARQNPKDPNRAGQSTANKPAITNDVGNAEHPDNEGDKQSEQPRHTLKNWINKFWSDPIVPLTAVLAVLALIQSGIYLGQLWTTHRSERAYLHLTGHVQLERFEPNADKPAIAFTIRNFGKTPGRVTAYNAVYWPGPLPRHNLPKRRLRPFPISLASGQEHSFSVEFKDQIIEEEYRIATHDERPTYVFGRITYRHKFQWPFTCDRHTDFCLRFRRDEPQPTDPAGSEYFGFSMVPEGFNETT